MRRKIITLLLLCCATIGFSYAQKVAIKHNFAYDALFAPNLGIEFSLGDRVTLDTQYSNNTFVFRKQDRLPEWSHWLAQSEVRYWTCESFNGLFFGLHALGGQFRIGHVNIPFVLENKNSVMKNQRYIGWYYGGGLSVGYQWVLSPRSSIELSVGGGYARIDYNKCTACGYKNSEASANYVGPTKATLSYIFFFK